MNLNDFTTLAKPRIEFLDELRGLCIVCMVFFHTFFDLAFIFHLRIGNALYNFFEPAQPFFAALFIIICGICCRLSRSNLKRSTLIAAAAILVSAVTVILSKMNIVNPIYFGILHLLAVSVFIFATLRRLLDKIPTVVGIIISSVLAAATRNIADGIIGIGAASINIPSSFPEYISIPLGIGSIKYAVSDYFPLFPWLFVFISGTYLGKYFASDKVFPLFYKKHVPLLASIGRHSLIIYVLHQPVIYGLLMLINLIINSLSS